MLKKVAGFTLIELLVAITILAVVSGVGYTTYSKAQIASRDAKRKQDLRSIATALALFKQQNSRYPCSAGNVWEFSTTSGDWLVDKCNSNQSISPDYINSTPADPLENNTTDWLKHGYRYWSEATSGWGSCAAKQYYFLATQLENDKDQDSFAHKPPNGCGENPITTGSMGPGLPGPNTYLIVGE